MGTCGLARFGHTRRMKRQKRARFLHYLESERAARNLYRELATLTTGERREALLELAEIEQRHADHWARQLEINGWPVPDDVTELDATSTALLSKARRSTIDAVLGDLEAEERRAADVYDQEPDATPQIVADEHAHAERLNALAAAGPDSSGGRPPASVEEFRESLSRAEHDHRADKSGSLRAAVFGVSDGLVSNTALVMGFAGSGISSSTVLFAGISGLLAGAFSMAAGEYVSVASQRDIFRREIAIEQRELEDNPREEQRELELIYRAKGLDRETAARAAEQIMSDPDTALDTLVREELGLDPDELGSPVKVAVASFVAFTAGAAVPVLPYVFASGMVAMWVAIGLSLLAMVAVGAAVGYSARSGVAKAALRQLAVGVAAAGVTFIIGSLIGSGLTG